MRRYVTLRDFCSNKSGRHCARAWVSTVLQPTCVRIRISITNKLNTAPRAGSRRAEHRTLLATCVKFGRGEEMREERQRIHENTPGVFHQFLIFWATCSDVFLTRQYSHFRHISSFIFFNLLTFSHFFFHTHFTWLFFNVTEEALAPVECDNWFTCVSFDVQVSNDKIFNIINFSVFTFGRFTYLDFHILISMI